MDAEFRELFTDWQSRTGLTDPAEIAQAFWEMGFDAGAKNPKPRSRPVPNDTHEARVARTSEYLALYDAVGGAGRVASILGCSHRSALIWRLGYKQGSAAISPQNLDKLREFALNEEAAKPNRD